MPDAFTPPGKVAESCERMQRIIDAYTDETGSASEDHETVVIDFLADLRHWVTDNNLRWSFCLGRADGHWAAETETPEAD